MSSSAAQTNKQICVFLLDNFDSFTYNLVDELRTLGLELIVYRNSVPADLVLQKRNTSDYSFITLMLRNLDKNGKAIAIIPGGALFNTIDQDVRKYLIDNGMIEAILELPDRMFYKTGIKTYMMILSF